VGFDDPLAGADQPKKTLMMMFEFTLCQSERLSIPVHAFMVPCTLQAVRAVPFAQA